MRTPTQRLNHMGFIKNGQSFLQCATLPCLRDHDPRRDVSGAPASSNVRVPLSIVSATLPDFHRRNARPTEVQQVMITTEPSNSRFCVHRATSHIRLQKAQRCRWPLPVLPVSSLPRIAMHVTCTQCPSSASELNSVDRRCV